MLASSLMGLSTKDKWVRTRRRSEFLRWTSRLGLWILGVKVSVVWRDESLKNLQGSGLHGYLLAGNHLSYLDVLVISSQVPGCFVTSVEIKETPGLGQICQVAGCLFVERRNKHNITLEIKEICEGLSSGLNVIIFPEATSTNGEQVLRFRKPLFLAAVLSERPCLPVALSYRAIQNDPVTVENRDLICWYGDMDFLPHLWKLSGLGSIEAHLNFGSAIAPAQRTAEELASLAQAQVEATYLAPRKKPDRSFNSDNKVG